jgi:hypothetical protein
MLRFECLFARPTQTITTGFSLNSVHRVVVEGMLDRRVRSRDRSAVETRNGDRLVRQGQTRGSGFAIPGLVLSLQIGCRFHRSVPAATRQDGTGALLVILVAMHTAVLAIQFLHSTIHIRHRIRVAGVKVISSDVHPSQSAFHFSEQEIGILVFGVKFQPRSFIFQSFICFFTSTITSSRSLDQCRR